MTVQNADVICEMCGYTDKLYNFLPCLGYNDIRCPRCGSTKNAHNREYRIKIRKAMK